MPTLFILCKEMILIAIFAFVFCNILTDPDMIFGWYYNLIQKLPKWLSKPLGACEYCFVGQLSLWYYTIKYFWYFDILELLSCVVGAIFIVRLINRIIYGLNNS